MKFEHYLKRVEDSREFREFLEKYKSSYLSAGFFVLDLETGKHMHQLDYFIPGSKKIATFIIDDGVKLKISEMKFKGKAPEKLQKQSRIDLDALKGIVHDEMLNRTVTQDVKKIIAVLVSENGKKVWKLNCITGDLGIIKVNVDDEKEAILEFEKASLFDMIKFLPKGGGGGMPQALPVQQAQNPQPIIIQPQPAQAQTEKEETKEKTEKPVKKSKK